MRKISTTAKLAVAGVSVGTLALSGVAYAYFSTTGSGTGSGSVGTSSALTIHQASATYCNAGTEAAPGENTLLPGTSVDVTWTVDNPSSGHQQLGTISLSSVTSDKTGCDSATHASWFSMTPVAENMDLAPGDGQTVTNGGTISFNNVNASQDVCKGAALTFHYSSN
jgi:hypothetical protein